MPVIAWILVVWFALSGFVALVQMVAKGTRAAKDATATAAATISILLTVALYGWLVWAVVQLATT